MTISTPPTAAAVRIASRLRPEQVNASYADTAALEADIASRITTYTAALNNKLAPVTTSAANQTIAVEALTLRVMASLYGSAGQLHPAYWERAKELKAQSDELIADLIASDAAASEDSALGIGAATLSTAPYRIDELTGELVVNA